MILNAARITTYTVLTSTIDLTASEKQHDNFCCIERNYQYLHCQWEGTDNTSCWRLTNSGQVFESVNPLHL